MKININTQQPIRAEPSDNAEQIVTATTTSTTYGVFAVGTPYSEIDARLWNDDCKPTDAENLQRLRELKSMAAPTHQNSFRMVLTIDRDHSKQWMYEFRLNQKCLYKSEMQLIGHSQDLDNYEAEFIEQTFARHFDCTPLKAGLQEFHRTVREPLSPKERMKCFQELASLVPTDYADRFERKVTKESEKSWSYTFAVDNVLLYRSEAIDMGDGDDLQYFLHLVVLQQFRKQMFSCQNRPEIRHFDLHKPELNDNASTFKPDTRLDVNASIALSFYPMALRAIDCGLEASIQIATRDTFALSCADRVLHRGPLVPQIEGGSSLSSRVLIALYSIRTDITKACLLMESAKAALINAHDTPAPRVPRSLIVTGTNNAQENSILSDEDLENVELKEILLANCRDGGAFRTYAWALNVLNANELTELQWRLNRDKLFINGHTSVGDFFRSAAFPVSDVTDTTDV